MAAHQSDANTVVNHKVFSAQGGRKGKSRERALPGLAGEHCARYTCARMSKYSTATRKYSTKSSESQVPQIPYHWALVKLVPYTKRPAARGWATSSPPSPEQVRRWLADGYGVGLRLGWQPDGRFLIAVDVDSSEGARWLFEQGGVPVCPAIKSARGHKYILSLPFAISYCQPVRGVEILGQGHQVALPSPYAPDDRFWAIPPSDVPDIPAPHDWLTKILRRHKMRAKRRAVATRKAKPAQTAPQARDANRAAHSATSAPKRTLSKELAWFCHNILPHRAVAGSNHPALLGAAIVGHRVSKLRGGDLVQQLAVVNEQLSEHERVSRRELAAIARCTEQRRYGFNARVYAERTGTPYHIARTVYSMIQAFDRPPSLGLRMQSREVTRRIQRTIVLHGQWVSPGVAVLDCSMATLAELAHVNPHTIHKRYARARVAPLVSALTTNGLPTRWVFAWNAQQLSIFLTFGQALRWVYKGGRQCGGLGGGVWGDGGSLAAFDARAGPAIGKSGRVGEQFGLWERS
jgi:hypothetical protein